MDSADKFGQSAIRMGARSGRRHPHRRDPVPAARRDQNQLGGHRQPRVENAPDEFAIGRPSADRRGGRPAGAEAIGITAGRWDNTERLLRTIEHLLRWRGWSRVGNRSRSSRFHPPNCCNGPRTTPDHGPRPSTCDRSSKTPRTYRRWPPIRSDSRGAEQLDRQRHRVHRTRRGRDTVCQCRRR